jgi:hypothetical protein
MWTAAYYNSHVEIDCLVTCNNGRFQTYVTGFNPVPQRKHILCDNYVTHQRIRQSSAETNKIPTMAWEHYCQDIVESNLLAGDKHMECLVQQKNCVHPCNEWSSLICPGVWMLCRPICRCLQRHELANLSDRVTWDEVIRRVGAQHPLLVNEGSHMQQHKVLFWELLVLHKIMPEIHAPLLLKYTDFTLK